MIIIFKEKASKEQINNLKTKLEGKGFSTNMSDGVSTTIMGIIGDTSKLNEDSLLADPAVEQVRRVQEAYKLANRKMHPEDTVIDIAGQKIGGGNFQVIAGPCSIESTSQITEVAVAVKESGAGLLRGGAFKPRTSPYAFQGLHEDGLDLLLAAGKSSELPIVTEIMSTEHIHLFKDVDVIQVGARNMQNFELLKELGKLDKPILLKRGLANTLEELIMSAEYIMAGGNEKVILCERGIRTFETSMRNTLDISAIPMLKKLTHLPIVIDPSHAAGIRWMVEPLALSAIAAGADGLMIEVHNNPEQALCDGPQSLTPQMFDELMIKINKTVSFMKSL